MNKRFLRILFLEISLILLASCANSPKVKFYTLNAIPRTGEIESPKQDMRIKIGPITLPENLHQPRIVTRQGLNIVKPAEFHRWSGELQSEIQNVLIENLSILLPTDKISLFHEFEPDPAEYQLIIRIRDFSGELGGQVYLNADWRLISLNNPKHSISEKTFLHQQTSEPDYQAFVAAQSLLLEKFSVIMTYALKDQIRLSPIKGSTTFQKD